MTSARDRVSDFWDEHMVAWSARDDPPPDPLPLLLADAVHTDPDL